jgi:AcrR family transcriptional regulator
MGSPYDKWSIDINVYSVNIDRFDATSTVHEDQGVTMTTRYHHGDLRAALVEAGLEATRAGGPQALGLREITRRVGVSANAAYRHFADRQALLDAVAAEIFARLGHEMNTAHSDAGHSNTVHSDTASAPDAALERLRAVGRGYIGFARREPGWFSVVFFGPTTPGDLASDPPPPYLALKGALDALVSAGVLSAERREGAQWLCWSAVHGFAELVLHGPLRDIPADEVDRLAERTIDAIIAGVIQPLRPG